MENNAGWWNQFKDMEYPFSPGNTLTGYVQPGGDNEYGSLVINHVNGRKVLKRC
jgi:hypothetical protein